MAVKRRGTRRKSPKATESFEDVSTVRSTETLFQPKVETKPKIRAKSTLLLMGAMALLLGYWYWTNSWPVTAFVGLKPITRSQINRELYKQNGQAVIDNLVTEHLVRQELSKLGIKATDEEVNTRLDEIKANLGEGTDLETVLSERGLTLADVKKQLGLQIAIEKALSDQASVSAQEVETYVTDNAAFLTGDNEEDKKQQAEKVLKQQKLQTQIGSWIEGLRTGAKVWRLPVKSN